MKSKPTKTHTSQITKNSALANMKANNTCVLWAANGPGALAGVTNSDNSDADIHITYSDIITITIIILTTVPTSVLQGPDAITTQRKTSRVEL